MLELPFDVLALLASWLDMHDLLYRLPLVCKLLYAVANDPVTWSRAVVRPCSYNELDVVLSKFGEWITVITATFKLFERVAQRCPKLKVAEVSEIPGDHIVSSSSYPPLVQFSCSSSMLCESMLVLAPTLTSLHISGGLGAVPNAGSIVSSFDNLKKLDVYDFFNIGQPTLFPHLETLVSASCDDAQTWDLFVEAHPVLRSLCFTSVPQGGGLAQCKMPANLTSLKVFSYRDRINDSGFLAALVAASEKLSVFECFPQVPGDIASAVFRVGSSMTRVALASRDFLTDELLELIKNLNLTSSNIRAPNVRPGSLNFIGTPHAVYALHPEAIHELPCDLRDMKSLTLNNGAMTVAAAERIGSECRYLKHISLLDVAICADAVAAIAPALARVVSVRIVSKKHLAPELFHAVAQSSWLSSLTVLDSPAVGAVVRECMYQLFETSLESLELDNISNADTEAIIDTAVVCGKRFRVLKLQNYFRDDSIVQRRVREWRLCGGV